MGFFRNLFGKKKDDEVAPSKPRSNYKASGDAIERWFTDFLTDSEMKYFPTTDLRFSCYKCNDEIVENYAIESMLAENSANNEPPYLILLKTVNNHWSGLHTDELNMFLDLHYLGMDGYIHKTQLDIGFGLKIYQHSDVNKVVAYGIDFMEFAINKFARCITNIRFKRPHEMTKNIDLINFSTIKEYKSFDGEYREDRFDDEFNLARVSQGTIERAFIHDRNYTDQVMKDSVIVSPMRKRVNGLLVDPDNSYVVNLKDTATSIFDIAQQSGDAVTGIY